MFLFQAKLCSLSYTETDLTKHSWLDATATLSCFWEFSSRSPTALTKELSRWQSLTCHDSEENNSIYVLTELMSPLTACHKCQGSVLIEITSSLKLVTAEHKCSLSLWKVSSLIRLLFMNPGINISCLAFWGYCNLEVKGGIVNRVKRKKLFVSFGIT